MSIGFERYISEKYSEAIKCFTERLAFDPGNISCLLGRAICNFKLQLYRKCLVDTNHILKLNNNFERAHQLKGCAEYALDKKSLAIDTWKKGSDIKLDLIIHYELICLISNPESTINNLYKNIIPMMNEIKKTNNSIPSVNESKKTLPKSMPKLESIEKTSLSSETPLPTKTLSTTKPQSKIQAQLSSEELRNKLSKTKRFVDPSEKNKIDHVPSEMEFRYASQNMKYKSSDPELNYLTTKAIFLSNTGNHEEASHIFENILQKDANVYMAQIGLGTVYAHTGNIEGSFNCYNRAIELKPSLPEGYKRRAALYHILNKIKESFNDINKAIELKKQDIDAYEHRGQMYMNIKNYREALTDFKFVTLHDHQREQIWLHIATCYTSMGNNELAVENCQKALSLQSSDNVEAFITLAQIHRDWGKYKEALSAADSAMKITTKNPRVYHVKAMLHFGCGLHHLAIKEFEKVVSLDIDQEEARTMYGIVNHALGSIRKAVSLYNDIVNKNSKNYAWYPRELALWWHKILDLPLKNVNPDLDFSPEFKLGHCKREVLNNFRDYIPQPDINSNTADITFSETTKNENIHRLVEFSKPYGALLHNDASGFLSNKRQQRMCGMAVVQIAQILRNYWFKGISTLDGNCYNFKHNQESNEINWRAIFNVAVAYRQFSEPNDPVWWVDLLPVDQYNEGFGSHTPMITGQCYTPRYAAAIEWSMKCFKEGIIREYISTDHNRDKIRDAKTCEEIYQIMKKNFYITTLCESVRIADTKLIGTRLSLEKHKDKEHELEYSIRTPCTPPRWHDYDAELKYAFDRLTEIVKSNPQEKSKIYDAILTMAFYWYNFMPLSRGTAACGYIIIIACFLAIGKQITSKIPKGEMVDWKAILNQKPDDFIDTVSPWMYKDLADVEHFDDLPSMTETFDTLRKLIEGFNLN